MFYLDTLVFLVPVEIFKVDVFFLWQEEQVSLREVQWEADQNHSLEAQRHYATDLEKQIEDLTQKLQSADAHYKQKVNIILAVMFNSEEKHYRIGGQRIIK